MSRLLHRVALVCFFPLGSAWSTLGHERMNRIAQDLLKVKQELAIGSLMHGDVVDFASWEHQVTNKYPDTKALHWHRQNPEWTCARYTGRNKSKAGNGKNTNGSIADPIAEVFATAVGLIRAGSSDSFELAAEFDGVQCDGNSAEKGSLFCALLFFFNEFAHAKLSEAYPQPLHPITMPLQLDALAKVPKDEQTPAHYLRWMVTLLGDLHQPLHWLRDHDFGKQINVSYQGGEYSLLDFWENYLLTNLGPPMRSDHIDAEYEINHKKWGKRFPPELFRRWAQEVAGKVCDDVYSTIGVVDNSSRGRIEITDETYKRWLALVDELTLIGGQRIAFILTDLLDHRKHKHAHAEGRAHFHHKRETRITRKAGIKLMSWGWSLLANLGCAIVLVPVLLVLLRKHEQFPLELNILRKAKLEGKL